MCRGLPAAGCPGEQSCNALTGLCEEQMFTVAIDCFDERVCVDGECQDGCSEDTDCPGARVCNAGQCVKVRPVRMRPTAMPVGHVWPVRVRLVVPAFPVLVPKSAMLTQLFV